MQAKCPQCGHCCRIDEQYLKSNILCHFCGKTWNVLAPHWPASGRIAVLVGVIILIPGAALMFLGSFGTAAAGASLLACAILLWIGTPLAVIGLWTIAGGMFVVKQHRREDVPTDSVEDEAKASSEQSDE